ncbi:MAG: hypothetical protein CL916_14040 [Deltaproteobacteria bacterium]|nr:hypothetical protein [Deltaproteobacteria bacterium]
MIESKIQTKIVREDLFCPICADNIYQSFENNTAPCPHVLYVYIDEKSEFVYSHNDIHNIVQEVVTELESDDESMMTLFELLSSIEGRENHQEMFQSMKEHQIHPVSLLSQRIKQESVLHLSITISGLASHTKENTIRIGYDFDVDSNPN